MSTCITNFILNITTNCKIHLEKYVACYGGQLTAKLPAARRIVMINNSRYSFLIHSTGKIILSNFYFDSNTNHLFSWILSLLFDLIRNKIEL